MAERIVKEGYIPVIASLALLVCGWMPCRCGMQSSPGDPNQFRVRGEAAPGMMDGLEMGIEEVCCEEPGFVSITLYLRHVQRPNPWLPEPIAPINILFWDSAGRELESDATQIQILVGDEFASQAILHVRARSSVGVPSTAHYLSLALGRSGLVTGKAMIPMENANR